MNQDRHSEQSTNPIKNSIKTSDLIEVIAWFGETLSEKNCPRCVGVIIEVLNSANNGVNIDSGINLAESYHKAFYEEKAVDGIVRCPFRDFRLQETHRNIDLFIRKIDRIFGYQDSQESEEKNES